MPAFYWIQLYKSVSEMSPGDIVQRTVNCLAESGCSYLGTTHNIVVGTPEEGQQVGNVPTEFTLPGAVNMVTRDLDAWANDPASHWLPTFQIVFDYPFRFDETVLEKLDEETRTLVRQVRVDFWHRDDPFAGRSVLINLDCWEEYVLTGGEDATHAENLQRLVAMIMEICERIGPHFGWLDFETNSFDMSYESLLAGEWPIGNHLVLVGPQLRAQLTPHQGEIEQHVVYSLQNGGLLLMDH